MARFKYLGEPPKPFVQSYGPMQEIRVPKKDGSKLVLTPIPPATTFPIGADLGYDITDERSIRILQADPRYQQIA